MKLGILPWDIARSGWEPGGFLDANPALESNEPVRIFMGEGGIGRDAKFMRNTSSFKDLVRAYLPSLYTGAMRRVMQVSLLRGEAFFTEAKHDTWLSEWEDTYGIFIGSPIDGVCQRFVIRICTAGIYRFPIRFPMPLPENWEALEAEAAGMSEQEAVTRIGNLWSAGDFDPTAWELIGPAPGLYSPVSGHPVGSLVARCGWAFNKRGTSAVNVGVHLDPADESGRRQYTRLYKVDITEEGGVPVSATTTYMGGGIFANPESDQVDGYAARLQTAQENPGAVSTWPFWPGASNMGGDFSDAPVFAFYDAADSLHVVRWRHDASSSDETDVLSSPAEDMPEIDEPSITLGDPYAPTSDGWTRKRSTGPLGGWHSHTGSIGNGRGFYSTSISLPPGDEGWSRSEGYHDENGNPGVIDNVAWELSGVHIDFRSYEYTQFDGEPATRSWMGFGGGDDGLHCYADAVGIATHVTTSDLIKQNWNVLVLHGMDRCSYAVYERQYSLENNRVTTHGGAEWAIVSGTIYVDWDQTGWGDVNAGRTDPDATTNVIYPKNTPVPLEPSGAYITFYADALNRNADHHAVGVFVSQVDKPVKSRGGGSLGCSTPTSFLPSIETEIRTLKCYVGTDLVTLPTPSDRAFEGLYHGGVTFNFKAAASVFDTGKKYISEGINGSTLCYGFGVSEAENPVTAFIGYF